MSRARELKVLGQAVMAHMEVASDYSSVSIQVLRICASAIAN